MSSPAFVRAYLRERGDEERCVALWHRVLLALASAPEHLPEFVAFHGLPAYLTPTAELDAVVDGMIRRVLGVSAPETKEMDVLKRLLAEPSKLASF